MPVLEPHLVEVDGAVLEVFTGGAEAPPICQVPHPIDPESPDSLLAELGRLVRVAPRGMGKSSAGPGRHELTIDRLVDDLEAVRQRLRVGRWVLHGFSGGGEVALRYALRYPDAVTALIVIGCPPGFRRVLGDPRTRLSPEHPEWKQLLARRSPPRPGRGLVWTQFAPDRWVCTEDGRPRMTQRSRPTEGGLPERARVVWEETVTFSFGENALGRLRAPALVLHGRHDATVPIEYGEELSAALPNAELVVFEHSRHGVATDEPERYQEVVRRFIAEHLGPPAATTTVPR
jgi:proline iminopeptidase